MFDRSKLFLMLLFVYVFGYGCAAGGGSRLPSPLVLTEDSAQREDLREGRSYYIRECATCHQRYLPDERRPEEWRAILGRHRGKVSFSEAQFGRLEGYIVRASGHTAGR